MNDIQRLIKTAMAEGISQISIANEAGLHDTTVYRVKTGKTSSLGKTERLIADAIETLRKRKKA